MSTCFSFTAPIVTEAEELVERDALTPEERVEIHNDLFGVEDVTEETPQMIQNGLAMMCSALEDIPPGQKGDYLEALERVPRLVESESSPLAFLRAEEYDAWAAAGRLVEHWKLRKKIFGPDKAFLPMTLNGAMAEDVEKLELGTIRLLPDDENGRAVLFFDRIQCGNLGIDRQTAHRCMFYLLCVLAERESAQRHGLVWVVNLKVRKDRFPSF
jgi:hypothetical protein